MAAFPASSEPQAGSAPGASLIVVDPSGHRTAMPIQVLPFRVGRQADNQLVMRDSRASRLHARIVMSDGEYVLEDMQSRHGTFVNGQRVDKHKLKNGDKIEFGSPDSYQLIFTVPGGRVSELLERFPAPEQGKAASGKLAKLRAVMEVARALQTSLSTQDVLTAVVDATLAVTGAERGFLLLRRGEGLEMRVARDHTGSPLSEQHLQVPRSVIEKALRQRRDLLSMNFDPIEQTGIKPEHSVADLELRSVVCVPLVRLRVGGGQETSMLSTFNDTVGVLYMDSRLGAADLSTGNRELLQSLALEASTILENARLLEEERAKQKIEEELALARKIQQSLCPRYMPTEGWFAARGSSQASLQVGGDYFDVIQVDASRWAVAVADVAGKGVSSALLACYLQGALSAAAVTVACIDQTLEMINRFLGERAEEGKYATVFYCTLEQHGALRYVNAGHCAPLVISHGGGMRSLETTSVPVGLVPGANFPAEVLHLEAGDKVVIYSDGVSEARGEATDFYGTDRLHDLVKRHATSTCEVLHDAILSDVHAFTRGAPQADDVTLVVFEYRSQKPQE